MAAYQQHPEVSSDVVSLCGDPSNFGLHMTSSVTSSLTSPVDSGVALLDSDADNTSVSEATINETDCLSLRDDREVSGTLREQGHLGPLRHGELNSESERISCIFLAVIGLPNKYCAKDLRHSVQKKVQLILKEKGDSCIMAGSSNGLL